MKLWFLQSSSPHSPLHPWHLNECLPYQPVNEELSHFRRLGVCDWTCWRYKSLKKQSCDFVVSELVFIKKFKNQYFFNYFWSFERGSHSAALARKKLIILGWPQIQDSTLASSYWDCRCGYHQNIKKDLLLVMCLCVFLGECMTYVCSCAQRPEDSV